jgi:alkylation response protein AidB-like acyl-CoA dehydrogenase
MRVAVGLHAACCGVRGFQESLAYAKERIQGSALGSKTQVPIIEHADVRRQLLAQKALSEGALHLCFFAASLVDAAKTDAEAATLLDVLIPVVKAWPSEWALEANKWAIQVLGGYGYTRDYPVERLSVWNQPVRRVHPIARSSGEEPASPRHRADVASMAWRTTR